jgi:hypothetical protein
MMQIVNALAIELGPRAFTTLLDENRMLSYVPPEDYDYFAVLAARHRKARLDALKRELLDGLRRNP